MTGTAIITAWNAALITQLLQHLWRAYDELHQEVLRGFDWSQPTDDLERDLTEKLFARLQRGFNFGLPVYPMHAQAERESRSAPPAQPPLYDIAFVLNADDRLCWPVESKVVKSDANTSTNLRDYVQTFNNRVLTFTYAPFSNSCSMISYLKSGDANLVLDRIATRIPCTMNVDTNFPGRVQRISDHVRSVPPGKPYQSDLRCHHMVMPLN